MIVYLITGPDGRRYVGQTTKRLASNGRRRLSPDDVRAVRAAVSAGESQQSVADRFGVSQTAVSRAVRRITSGWVL